MTVTDSPEPARPNNSCASVSPTSYGRFPTYSFRPMTLTPRRAATFPIAGIGVGWMLSRSQAELQKERVKKARYAGGRQVRGNTNGTLARAHGIERRMILSSIGFSHLLCHL